MVVSCKSAVRKVRKVIELYKVQIKIPHLPCIRTSQCRSWGYFLSANLKFLTGKASLSGCRRGLISVADRKKPPVGGVYVCCAM